MQIVFIHAQSVEAIKKLDGCRRRFDRLTSAVSTYNWWRVDKRVPNARFELFWKIL
jgi:hypothetical protein